MALAAAAYLVVAVLFSGCCTFSKRSCFPECEPPIPVPVGLPCVLPPLPELPAAARVKTEECPEKFVCYDIDSAKKILAREMAMRSWILEAQVRCKARPDAGPPSGG